MADIYPGDEGASPEYLLVYDSKLFFQAEDSTNGEELWAFDQDSGLASLVADIQVGSEGSHPFSLILYDDTLYFVAVGEDQVGFALWSLTPAPVANEPSAVPQPAHLHAPHPNPARSGATVSFDIAEAGPVRVEVLDVLGRRVALLADGPVAAGEHALRWEAGALPSGLYLVRLTAGDTVQTQRLTLVR